MCVGVTVSRPILRSRNGQLLQLLSRLRPDYRKYLQSDPIGILKDFSEPQMQVAMMLGVPLIQSTTAIAVDFFHTSFEVGYFDLYQHNHLYVYASGSPLLYTDPFGLFDKEAIKKKFCQKANESCDKLHKRVLKFCMSTGAGFYACKTLADDVAVDCMVGGFPGCKEDDDCEAKSK